MRLLLDTCVVMDVFVRRNGYKESLNVLKYCEARKVEGLITTAATMDVMRILRKHMGVDKMRETLHNLFIVLSDLPIEGHDIYEAIADDMLGCDRVVEMCCAKINKVDYIITHNKKDYVNSPVPALLPSEILPLLG